MTVLRLAVEFAVGLLIDVPTQVIHNKKIQKSVIVYVYPHRPDRPQRTILRVPLCQSGFLGHVREGTIAIIVVQDISIDSAHKDILIAIVIEVADGHAHVKASAFESRLFCNIRKSTVAIVVEQAIPIFW